MADLKTVTQPAEVAASLLPHLVGMVGGSGAALLDEHGTILGTHGQAPDSEEPSFRLELSNGWMLVWGSPYTPVFGRQELELMRAVGGLADLALERIRVANRDAELAAVVDASGDAIVSTGLDGTIRSWNPAAEAIYGRPAGQAIGQPFTTVVPADRADQAGELLGRVAQGERVSLETRHLGGDGETFSVSLTAAPLRAAGGTVLGMSVVARDITEHKRAERALREAKREADRANVAKSEFLSRMSHELRTPLNAILGFGQLLQLDDLTADQSESVEHMLRGGRHLLELINEVLDISRIESGNLSLSPEPVELHEVVRDTVDLIRPLAAERQITIQAPAADDPPWTVQADRQRLKQVLLNLASNAVKYNRHAGTIRVTCRATREGRVAVAVQDTGPGLSPDKMARLFSPFDRLGAEDTEVQGTGMGLALSKGLVEAMGGDLTAHSVEGEGTTFTVELAEPAEVPSPS
jgi:PAS domain S-box-containing protein